MDTDCSAPVEGRRCLNRARTEVDGKPLCTAHAAAAARRAAEAAQEAAWWQDMFTPTPEAPYRADPEWQAAQRTIVRPPGANACERTAAVLMATCRRYAIETGRRLDPGTVLPDGKGIVWKAG